MVSVESNLRIAAITAIGPIAWGSTYVITNQVLPADAPLWGAALRAAPGALVLLAISRTLPRGAWIWRAAVLGMLNVGIFFWLLYISSQLLPSSVAATVMAGAPIAMVAFAWALASERPTARVLIGAVVGMTGVPLVVGAATGGIDPVGVAASFAGLVLSSLAFALSKRWRDHVTPLQSCAWQLMYGGGALVLAALLFEGLPPALGVEQVAGFAYVSIVATALANVCWFYGLERLPAGVVGLVGLLNPVTGVVLGMLVANETVSIGQFIGMVIVALGIVIGVRSDGPGNDEPAADGHVEPGVAATSQPSTTPPAEPEHAPA